MSDSQNPQNISDGNGKTIAIISYITLIGWVIAFVMHSNDKSEFGAFHLRQSIGLVLTSLALSWIPILNLIVFIGLLVLWILGLVSAVNGEMKPVPLLGDFFQKTFQGLK